MAMMEISVVPVGTRSPSVSRYVADAVRILQNEAGIRYELTAMGTIIEGELEHLLLLAGKIHRAVLAAGALRVLTTIKIDERRDKPLSMKGKITAVKEKLGK